MTTEGTATPEAPPTISNEQPVEVQLHEAIEKFHEYMPWHECIPLKKECHELVEKLTGVAYTPPSNATPGGEPDQTLPGEGEGEDGAKPDQELPDSGTSGKPDQGLPAKPGKPSNELPDTPAPKRSR
jgi:hypothetical protein